MKNLDNIPVSFAFMTSLELYHRILSSLDVTTPRRALCFVPELFSTFRVNFGTFLRMTGGIRALRLYFHRNLLFPTTVPVYQFENTWKLLPCYSCMLKRKKGRDKLSDVMAPIPLSLVTTRPVENLMATRVARAGNAQRNWFHINYSFYRNNPRSFCSMVFISARSSVARIHYGTHSSSSSPMPSNINIQIVTENDLIDNSHFSMKTLFLRCQIYGI